MFRNLSIDLWKKTQRKNETERNNSSNIIFFFSFDRSIESCRFAFLVSLVKIEVAMCQDFARGERTRDKYRILSAWVSKNTRSDT